MATTGTELEIALEENSKELNELSNTLNSKYLALEKKLSTLGVSAWSPRIIGKKDDSDYGYRFGFCRINRRGKDGEFKKEWRFACQKVSVNEDGTYSELKGGGKYKNFQPEPIVEASRLLRIEASKLVEEILQSLKLQSDKFNNDLKTAVNTLTEADV